MKQSLYIETTIPSYLAARTSTDIVIAGRQAVTREFWESERHNYNLFVSPFVHDECARGDSALAMKRIELLKDIEILSVTNDVEPLADVYMGLLSLPTKSRADAMHLAICCINEIDILLSWNFAHLGTESMQVLMKHNDSNGISTPLMIAPDSIVRKYMEVDINE